MSKANEAAKVQNAKDIDRQVNDVWARMKVTRAIRLADTLAPGLLNKSVEELALMVGTASVIQDAQFLASKRLVHGTFEEDCHLADRAISTNVDVLMARATALSMSRKVGTTKEEVF